MATNYPTTLDTFTNPLATDQMSAPPHATQHADANDAIIAIQTKIGVNGAVSLTTIEGRLGAAESDIDQLQIDVPALSGRVTTAEGEIDTLQTGKANNPHGNEAHSSTFVADTRTIGTGTGLSGGGTLAADRTLAIDSTVTTQFDVNSPNVIRKLTQAEYDAIGTPSPTTLYVIVG